MEGRTPASGECVAVSVTRTRMSASCSSINSFASAPAVAAGSMVNSTSRPCETTFCGTEGAAGVGAFVFVCDAGVGVGAAFSCARVRAAKAQARAHASSVRGIGLMVLLRDSRPRPGAARGRAVGSARDGLQVAHCTTECAHRNAAVVGVFEDGAAQLRAVFEDEDRLAVLPPDVADGEIAAAQEACQR